MTAKNRFQILILHPKKHTVKEKNIHFFQCQFTEKNTHLGATRHRWKHLQHPGTAWNNAPWDTVPCFMFKTVYSLINLL